MGLEPPSLSLTDWVVLGLVAEKSRHGFAVAGELRPGTPLGQVWTVHRPLVYRAVDHLVSLGLLERTKTEPGKQGPHRTLLRATSAGRAALREWLGEPVEHARLVRSELMAKFVILDRLGLPLSPLAGLQLERFRPLVAGMTRAARQSTGTDRLVAMWRLESMRATERMLRRVAQDRLGPGLPPADRPSAGGGLDQPYRSADQ